MTRNGITAWLVGLAQLSRIESCIPAMAYALLGAYLSSDLAHLLAIPVLSAALLVWLLVAFGFVINDYRDALADSLSKPQRPIPAGRISRRAAGRVALILAPLALGVAMTLGSGVFTLALSCLIASTVYSYWLKNTVLIGNITVAILDATIPLYGGLAAGGITPIVWVAGMLTFFYILAQEVLYTVEDEKGDRQFGLHTTATWLGTIRAVRLFQLFALGFVAAALLPWLIGIAPNRYLYALIPCTILPLLAIVIGLAVKISDYTLYLAVWGTWYIWFSSLLPVVLLR